MSWATFHPKTTAAAFAGALTVILVAEAQRRGYMIDATEAASITVILTSLAAYFMPSDPTDAPPQP